MMSLSMMSLSTLIVGILVGWVLRGLFVTFVSKKKKKASTTSNAQSVMMTQDEPEVALSASDAAEPDDADQMTEGGLEKGVEALVAEEVTSPDERVETETEDEPVVGPSRRTIQTATLPHESRDASANGSSLSDVGPKIDDSEAITEANPEEGVVTRVAAGVNPLEATVEAEPEEGRGFHAQSVMMTQDEPEVALSASDAAEPDDSERISEDRLEKGVEGWVIESDREEVVVPDESVETESEDERVVEHSRETIQPAMLQHEPHDAPADFSKLSGIGPKMNQSLAECGITTYQQIMTIDVDELQKKLKEVGARPNKSMTQTWAKQASLAAVEDWDGLKTYQDQLKKK